MSTAHRPVLYAEALQALNIKPDGFYIDATFGRGGHSAGILKQLGPEGGLLAIDKDPQAIDAAKKQFGADSRFVIRRGSFARLEEFIHEAGLHNNVAGVLMDLGVSSPQLDDPERGFSFSHDGPLDMRMDTETGLPASEWLQQQDEASLAKVLKDFGEERFAKRVARAIIQRQKENPFTTTEALAEIIRAAIPAWEKHKDPAMRSFQAIRIAVNNELGDLEAGLNQALKVLRVGGRLVVISFHSLEDRIVKRFMRQHSRPAQLPKRLPVIAEQVVSPLKLIGKAIRANDAEVTENPRARSAVLRVAEKQI
ncbi:MAG TPA: 16S rRNA (cytosine(1402)-N(4))-methyltransferase RsmH [Chromatiales bacterium]|nr:16S rRNA (cytosine(1402)-N(4))-methyltransferase RsmH [Thiotrichales bacterium]HIP69458.1 16S rRNA (cytosine(1402)-N(4))-methyltransferase RsmH [Chromatiales bacterium]